MSNFGGHFGSMREVIEVPCRSREATEPAATFIHTAMPVAAVADERLNR